MLRCVCCHSKKSIEQFTRKNKAFKICNSCSEYHKSYYRVNSEKIKKYKKDNRAEDPQKEKEKRKRLYILHKEEIKQQAKDFRKNNPEVIEKQNKRNKVKTFLSKYKLPISFQKPLEQQLEQTKNCPICGVKFEYGRKNKWNSASFDHIVPGLNEISNLQIICTRCNRIKYNLTLNELKQLSEDNLQITKSNLTINKSRLEEIYNKKKLSAQLKNIPFSITKEDLKSILVSTCPIFKIPMHYFSYKRTFPNNYSIDRIDSSKGYIPGNCRIISFKANCAKWKASPQEIKKIYNYVKMLLDFNYIIKQ